MTGKARAALGALDDERAKSAEIGNARAMISLAECDPAAAPAAAGRGAADRPDGVRAGLLQHRQLGGRGGAGGDGRAAHRGRDILPAR
jgi:aryl-alcohol dehydrogenase-like predicted oxidoreductase